MEKGALVQVSVRLFWLSAVTVVQSIGDWWWTKRRSDKLLSMYSGFPLSLLFAPCESSGGQIGAGTDFSLSVSFHQYPIPTFCMKILTERQTSEVWESGRCDRKTTVTFLSFVHGSDQTIGRYCLSVLSWCCEVCVNREGTVLLLYCTAYKLAAC